MTRREWAFEVFGLKVGSSEAEIKEAYRDLVAVWHPDRHNTNDRLRKKAEEMMKRINEAKDILLRGADPYGFTSEKGEPGVAPNDPPNDENTEYEDVEERHVEDGVDETSESDEVPREPMSHTARPSRRIAKFVAFAMVLGAIVIFAPQFFAPQTPKSTTPSSSANVKAEPELTIVEEPDSPPETDTDNQFDPEKSFYIAIASYSNRNEASAIKFSEGVNWGGQEAFVLDTDGAIRNGYTNLRPGLSTVIIGPFDRATAKTGAVELATKFKGAYVLDFSSSSEPDQDAENQKSSADLSEHVGSSIKPSTQSSQDAHYTIGSSDAKVLELQGTPTSIRNYGSTKVFSFGLSTVEFANGVLTEYSNVEDNLLIQVDPKTRSKTTYFKIGSTEDEVLSVQGTPTSIRRYSQSKVLSYGLSTIDLENGIVTEYANVETNLRIKM